MSTFLSVVALWTLAFCFPTVTTVVCAFVGTAFALAREEKS